MIIWRGQAQTGILGVRAGQLVTFPGRLFLSSDIQTLTSQSRPGGARGRVICKEHKALVLCRLAVSLYRSPAIYDRTAGSSFESLGKAAILSQ